MIERRQSDFATVINDSLRGTIDQRTHVLDAVSRRLGPLGLQVFDVANLSNELLKQHVDACVFGALAQR